MNPVQYIVANQGLGMSAGKLAAQVAHAAVKGYELSFELWLGAENPSNPNPIHEWNRTGHTKIVLAARDSEHLMAFRQYASDREYRSVLIIDEGRTEVPSHSPTALGFEILDKASRDVAFTFADLPLYRDKIKVTLEIDR